MISIIQEKHINRCSSSFLYHGGKWGYTNGIPNGKRKAAAITNKSKTTYTNIDDPKEKQDHKEKKKSLVTNKSKTTYTNIDDPKEKQDHKEKKKSLVTHKTTITYRPAPSDSTKKMVEAVMDAKKDQVDFKEIGETVISNGRSFVESFLKKFK